jgi:plastocyanin
MSGRKYRSHFMSIAAGSLVALAAPTAAQSGGSTIDIEMSSFKFRPATIQLDHGRDYVLHFVNAASGGHDFSAPAFFAAAKVAPADRGKLSKGGRVALGGHEEARIHLTAPAAAGHYKVRCTHFMHTTFGMTGDGGGPDTQPTTISPVMPKVVCMKWVHLTL